MASMFFIQESSDTHWWTMCSSGVQALGAGRKPRSASPKHDHTLSVLSRSVS